MNAPVAIHCGDCLDVVRGLADNSIDSVVTDPPYALVSITKRFGKEGAAPCVDKRGESGPYMSISAGFMGRAWDNGATAFSVEFWAEILRVLRPGGHVAAFGGTRSYHRLACAIEDAGFEIRDQLAWCYGSGFPKSHDVSKGIDKAAGAERVAVGSKLGRPGYSLANGGSEEWGGLRGDSAAECAITAPATDAARQWAGFGTALKPAWEPICLARKPLSERTVAANCLRWGTGAINVDGCRVATSDALTGSGQPPLQYGGENHRPFHDNAVPRGFNQSTLGRFPANLCHDGSQEVLAAFPETKSGVKRGGGYGRDSGVHEGGQRYDGVSCFGDSGSAARFFYSAKADEDNRIGSRHPTVKPVDLMQWLCRLITPPGGIVLDPFAGSGTTGEAAWREGFSAILIEREAEHQADIRRRMAHVLSSLRERSQAIVVAKDKTAHAGPLFEEVLK